MTFNILVLWSTRGAVLAFPCDILLDVGSYQFWSELGNFKCRNNIPLNEIILYLVLGTIITQYSSYLIDNY